MMTAQMIYPNKPTAALMAAKLAKKPENKGKTYAVRQVPQGFEVYFRGYHAQPTGSFSTPEDAPKAAPAPVKDALHSAAFTAKPPAKGTKVAPKKAAGEVAAYNAGYAEAVKAALPVAEKKPSTPHALKEGAATGDDVLAAPVILPAGETVTFVLPFRGESAAYVDAYFNGKPISFGRSNVRDYAVEGTRVTIQVDTKFAKKRKLVA